VREPPQATAAQKQLMGLPRLAGFDRVQCRRAWALAGRKIAQRTKTQARYFAIVQARGVRRRGRTGGGATGIWRALTASSADAHGRKRSAIKRAGALFCALRGTAMRRRGRTGRGI